jgi:hypothetical protein
MVPKYGTGGSVQEYVISHYVTAPLAMVRSTRQAARRLVAGRFDIVGFNEKGARYIAYEDKRPPN